MKSKIASLGKNSLIYGVGSAITRFSNLLLLPIFTAYFSPEEFGILAMLGILSMVAQPVFSLGLGAAMGPAYFNGENPFAKAQTVWTAFAILLVSSALLIGAAWLIPSLLCQLVLLPTAHANLVSVSLTGCALTVLTTAFMQRIQFEQQARLYVVINTAIAIISLCVCVFTIIYKGWGVRGMVFSQALGNLVTFILFSFVTIKAIRPCFSKLILRELLRVGLPMIPSFAFLFIMMHGNKYILQKYAGLDQVGIYSIGFNLGTAMSIVAGGISTAWYPFFMSYLTRQDEARDLFGKIFTYYVLGAGGICLLFFIFARPVVMLLTKPSFYDAYMIVGLIALANFFTGIYSMFLPGIYYKQEISMQAVIQAVAVAFSLPLNFIFIKQWGVVGAALGVVLGHFLMALLTYIWNVYRGADYIKPNYEWGRIGIISFAFCVLGMLSFPAYSNSLYVSFSISLFLTVSFIIICFLLLNPIERKLFNFKSLIG